MANELIKQCARWERLFKSWNGPEDTMTVHVGGGQSIKKLTASSSPLEVSQNMLRSNTNMIKLTVFLDQAQNTDEK